MLVYIALGFSIVAMLLCGGLLMYSRNSKATTQAPHNEEVLSNEVPEGKAVEEELGNKVKRFAKGSNVSCRYFLYPVSMLRDNDDWKNSVYVKERNIVHEAATADVQEILNGVHEPGTEQSLLVFCRMVVIKGDNLCFYVEDPFASTVFSIESTCIPVEAVGNFNQKMVVFVGTIQEDRRFKINRVVGTKLKKVV